MRNALPTRCTIEVFCLRACQTVNRLEMLLCRTLCTGILATHENFVVTPPGEFQSFKLFSLIPKLPSRFMPKLLPDCMETQMSFLPKLPRRCHETLDAFQAQIAL